MGAENVGVVMAYERGFFEDAGLNVWVGAPVWPWRPVPYVADETVDLGVAQLPQVVLAREDGKQVKAVGSLVSHPTAAMIWLRDSGLRSIRDLEGKTVATPGVPFQEALLESVLRGAGLSLRDVEVKRVGYKLIPALLNGRADAIFGGSWNLEGAALEAQGADPVIKPVRNLGVPVYDELVVVARTATVQRKPKLIRRFMAAVARGTAAAAEDPAAAGALIEESGEPNPERSRKEVEAEVESTLPLLSKGGGVSLAQTDRLLDWMHEEGLVDRRMVPAEVLAGRYLTAGP